MIAAQKRAKYMMIVFMPIFRGTMKKALPSHLGRALLDFHFNPAHAWTLSGGGTLLAEASIDLSFGNS